MKGRTICSFSRWVLSTVVCLSLSMMSPLVWAHEEGGAHGHGHTGYAYGQHLGHHQNAGAYIHHLLMFKKAMAFTDEQEAALRHLETSYEKTRIKMEAKIASANIDLHELLHNDQANLSDVEVKLHSIFSLKADRYMASIRTRQAAKAVLTEEQRKRMKTVHDRLKAMGTSSMSSPYPHHSREEKQKR